MITGEYNREHAYEYAKKWARGSNPLFFNFTGVGGDCTNFVSQAIYAGTCQMNYTDTFGWYYISATERAPAWTGVEFLYNFITGNDGLGPFGHEASEDEMEIGDFVQFGKRDGSFYHTLLITGFSRRGILVSAHSANAQNRALRSYSYKKIRYIHIDGYRTEIESEQSCFDNFINGISF